MVVLVAGESFLEIGETSPGVGAWGAFGGDAPEIEDLLASGFGVQY